MSKFVFREKEYENFTACYKEFGLTQGAIYYYIKKYNMSKQEALEHCLNPCKPLIYNTKWTFEFRGKTYKSFAECCKEFGLDYNKTYYCVQTYNMSKQEALEYYLNLNRQPLYNTRRFEFRGVHYTNLKECCKEFGLTYERVSYYAKKDNISKQEALEYCLSSNSRTYTRKYTRKDFEFRGVIYKNFKTCCKEFGFIDSTVISCASRNSMSKQEALEYLDNTVAEIKRLFTFQGVTYKNLRTCCECLGLNFHDIFNYSNRNKVSKVEALEHFLQQK